MTAQVIVPLISRGAAGIALGAALVMAVYLGAAMIGYPLNDRALGDAALWVSSVALAIWALARFIERRDD